MEIVGIVILIISPIYWGLYRLNGDLREVKAKVGFLWKKNGGLKEK